MKHSFVVMHLPTICCYFERTRDEGPASSPPSTGANVYAPTYLHTYIPTYIQMEASTSPALIANLSNDESYTVTIAGRNAVGLGPFSQISDEVRAMTPRA